MEWAEDEKEFVSYEYRPEFRVLGPRFGKQSKAVAEWIKNSPDEMTRQLDANLGSPLKVADAETGEEHELNWIEAEVDGEKFVVDATCFEVHLEEKAETSAQRDGNLLLVLDTHVSDELKLEGLAREVVNRIQTKRKELNLDYADRISVEYSAPDALAAAVEAHREYIAGETLATSFARVETLSDGAEESEVDGSAFGFVVKPA